MYKIYAHINKTNNKVYVGQTCRDPEIRWNKGKGYIYNPKFNNAITKYGWDGFDHIILEDNLTREEASIAEQKWIKQYDSYKNGYNATTGGEINYTHNGKPILQIDPNNGNILNIFKTSQQAEKYLNLEHHQIKNICQSEKVRYGYYWCELENYKGSFVLLDAYKNINTDYIPNIKKYERGSQIKYPINKKDFFHKARSKEFQRKPVITINKETQETILYSSISELSRVMKKPAKTIRSHLENGKPIKIKTASLQAILYIKYYN